MRIVGFIGIFVLILIAWLFSKNKKNVNYRLIAWGLGLQWVLAVLVLGIPALNIAGPLAPLFEWSNGAILALMNFTAKGSEFVFGPMMSVEKNGFIFAVQVLPTIIFFSSLVAVGYHIGLLQKVVSVLARIMQKTMGTSGAESLSAAANIFVGQTEAPLLIRPFISKLTSSELMAVMTAGMATVAGGVMAAYVGLLKDALPTIAGHLLTASVMSAPAALLIAKIMIPEDGRPDTLGRVPETNTAKDANVIEAVSRGAGEGVTLAINVGAMLLAFIALIAMANAFFAYLGHWIGFAEWGGPFVPQVLLNQGVPELSLQLILGWLFAPLAWIMGVPWNEAVTAGAFLGEKIALNEFVAYLHLSQVAGQLSERTLVILSYALCGFANFSSIGIQIGGIGSLEPGRRSDLAKLGVYSVIGGSLAAFMTAAIAGVLI